LHADYKNEEVKEGSPIVPNKSSHDNQIETMSQGSSSGGIMQ
jgi:hypothetical protein